MTAQDILKLIETVSPSDTAKLDEIDARVWCWLNEKEYLGNTNYDRNGIKVIVPHSYLSSSLKTPISTSAYRKLYTRSRDALKAIRPEGWCVYINEYNKGVNCILNNSEGYTVRSDEMTTEELAELHAILQAIEYERNNK